MDQIPTAVIALNFTDGGPRNRPWLESPQSSFIILFPETNDFRFVPSGNLTLKEALNPSGGGLAATFVVINCALMIQRVKDRLAQCEATRQP